MEEKGEDLGEDLADDWIVDDDGGYGVDDEEKKWGNGRTEVGEYYTFLLRDCTYVRYQSM